MSNIFLKIVARDFGRLAGMISWGWYYYYTTSPDIQYRNQDDDGKRGRKE